MNTLQDVREAQQMWEWKFKNAGRESIVLNCGKSGSIAGLLNRITGNSKAPAVPTRAMLKDGYQAV
jgi:hypothetical protein